jgi:hypothetical protein
MLAISHVFTQDGGFLARVVDRVFKVQPDLEAANVLSEEKEELEAPSESGSREPETVRRSDCLIYLDVLIH